MGTPTSPGTGDVGGVRFLNTGSVGKPKDGDWRAGYVLVEANEEIGPLEFVRVEYDLERAVEGVLASEFPDEFADQLRPAERPTRWRSRREAKEKEGGR